METDRVVRTSCRGCHGVCQVLVHLDDAGNPVEITGDPESPTSKGYICPKGAAGIELANHPDRLRYPLRRVGPRGSGQWERIGWDEALSLMTEKFDTIRKESGPEYIALCQGTGRPYTEFTGRFIHALGSPNYVSPGHNCFLPRNIAAHFTMGWLPIADIYGRGGKYPECIVFFGCNSPETGAADGMCGSMVKRAMKEAKDILVIDPRRTKTAEKATLHLQLRPGSECALALALLHVIVQEKLYDPPFVKRHCFGFEDVEEHVEERTPEWAEPITRVPADDIRKAARIMAKANPPCFLWGNGIDTSINAFQTGRAILMLMALTGSLDKPGGMVRWVPPAKIRCKSPQEDKSVVGMQFLSKQQKQKMIGADKFPCCPGCHQPTFWDACLSGDPYRPRAIWLVGTNPMLTATRGDNIETALRDHIEFTVVSDFFMTPAAELADLVLPAAHWLEQDDVVYFHKIWCVLARKKLMQVGEARDDRAVMLELANRLGLTEAFPWKDWEEYLAWVLEPSGMSFDEFVEKGIVLGKMSYDKYFFEGFPTQSKKVQLFSSPLIVEGSAPLPKFVEPPLSPISTPELAKDYPFILMTGCKTLPYFHSEGRQIASLRALRPKPRIAIHPAALDKLGIADGAEVKVSTPYGEVTLFALADDGLHEDVVQADHAWWYPEADGPGHNWKEHNVNLLFGHDHFDPDCGAEPLKCSLCRIESV